MKQAVDAGLMEKSALAVPYQNLAAMQRSLGDDKAATEFERLAESVVAKQNVKHSVARKSTTEATKR